MNEAYVFQHATAGTQLFVYHAKSVEEARTRFESLVFNPEEWLYLCRKRAIDVF